MEATHLKAILIYTNKYRGMLKITCWSEYYTNFILHGKKVWCYILPLHGVQK
jgi:hypothetical protein